MKKLFTLFIYIGSLLLGFTSCGDEAFDVDSVNKQTLLIMHPWTNDADLYFDLQGNLEKIENAIKTNKGLKSTRVFVFQGTSANQSELFELTYNSSNFTVERTSVNSYTGNAYTTTEGLTQILHDVKEKAEALNYALIIGSHGTGWLSAPTRSFGGNTASTAINVTSLAEAIQKNSIKMQYILFDACYMGNVETAYELKDATNILVASPNEIMSSGIPYDKVWSYLNTSIPNYSSIVSTFCSYYKETDTPYASLAAIDCRQLPALAAIMKDINQNYTITAERLKGVQVGDRYSPNIYYDLTNYVDSIHVSGVLKDKFITQMKATVKAAQSTEKAFIGTSTPAIEVKDFSGLATSDPSTNPTIADSKKLTSWWKATH